MDRLCLMPTLAAAVDRGNPDELLKIVDRLCKERAWDQLLNLKHRCIDALDRGKQLWPIAEHIDYRLALEAPASWGGPIVVAGAGRFTLGPLTEVIASTHTWHHLSPHLEQGPSRRVVAQERAIRGDVVDEGGGEIPIRLQPWEPTYPVATYHDREAEFPPPELPSMALVDLPRSFERIHDPESLDALEAITSTWTNESNGRCETAAVAGSALEAIAAFGLEQALVAELSPQTALAFIAWAGANGGAHGRRPGAAAGRFAAWWAVATLTDAEWPADPEELGRSLSTLRWYVWSDLFPPTGWVLQIAVEDPPEGLAWAVSAVDAM
jgi:hypothetical protein